jgi:putative tricarboxylic transport membrane protein
MLTALFGVLGYVFIRLECEPAPMLLGFILGPLMEENLRRAMLIARGDPTTFVTRPISGGLIALAVLLLVAAVLPMIAKKRDEVFVED